jgi:FtsZ-interacting cell division protein ZipA
MNNTEQLRDIKPLLEIPDNSYYIYIGFLIFIGLVVLVILFFLVKKFWLNRKKNIRKVYFEKLKEVNWDNPKESAYAVTYLGRELCKEERSLEIYKQIVPMLEPYKYRKEVPKVDDETLKQYNLLVHVIDESI